MEKSYAMLEKKMEDMVKMHSAEVTARRIYEEKLNALEERSDNKLNALVERNHNERDEERDEERDTLDSKLYGLSIGGLDTTVMIDLFNHL